MKACNANRRGRNTVAPSSTGPKVENRKVPRGSTEQQRHTRRQVGTPKPSSNRITRVYFPWGEWLDFK